MHGDEVELLVARSIFFQWRDFFDSNGTFSEARRGSFVGPRALAPGLVGAPPRASGREAFEFEFEFAFGFRLFDNGAPGCCCTECQAGS